MPDNIDSTRLVAVDYDPFSSPELQRAVATTESQREVWLADRLGRDASLAFNESVSLHFDGTLNVPALKSSIQRLIERHEALRATISADGTDFCISSMLNLAVLETDLSQFSEANKQQLQDERRQAHVTEAFDLEQGPLIRAEIIRLGPTEHELIITAHHIVCDGWSFWVLVRELASLYRLQVGAPEPALVPADSFAEFALQSARANQTDEYVRDENYWLAQFAEGAPVLELPTDRPRPPVRTFASEREDRLLDPALAAELKQVGAKHGASLFAAVMATFAALLYRLSGQTRVVIGVPAAGQSVEGRTELIGHCVNLLPVQIDIEPSASYSEHLAHVTNVMMDAFEHQHYTFGTLLKRLSISRDPSRQPLVSAMINIDQALSNEISRFPELAVTFGANARQYESFELFINAAQVEAGIRLECQYNKTLFDRSTVRRWLDCFESLMRGWLAEPGMPVERLPLLGNEEKLRVDAMQPAATEYPNDATVETLIEACVELESSRCAVRFGDESWSYGQLESYANRMAHCLRARGIRRGSRVGICLDRSIEMVGSLLAVLKAGGAYVPLDPVYPVERLRFMVEDADLAVLVSEGELATALEFPADRTLRIDADAAEIEAVAATRLPRDTEAADADSIAYVIYTSGSTGKPKGVQVQHQAVVNLLCSLQREPGLSSRDRLLAVTTISFDIHVLELWLPLMSGAEVVLAGRDTLLDTAALRALLESSGATCMQATPTLWRPLIEAGWKGTDTFKVLSGGESLPADLAEQLLERCGELWNLYGPTETTVWSTCCRVSNPRAAISIGRPIANTCVYVLDEQQQLCPIGVPGEMYIGGDGVTAGYLNRADLTAERFPPDPYSNQAGARLYRTGDRGRWLANGTLEHLGRLDLQVKLRGFRIELGEVEVNLTTHESIGRAVVIVHDDEAGGSRLIAYVVAREAVRPDESGLRSHLKATLPEYMIPQHFVFLNSIPLLPNGKVDRKSLPEPMGVVLGTARDYVQPRNEVERRVAALMAKALVLPDVSIFDDFFSLGGHSLLAARLTMAINREFKLDLPFRSLFECPTVARLSEVIDSAVEKSDNQTGKIPHRPDQSHAPLSLMQQRVWFLEQLNPGRQLFNTPSAHRLLGRLNENAFQQAFNVLIERQNILRTEIGMSGDTPIQRICPSLVVALFPAIDLSALAPDRRETEMIRQMRELNDAPVDIGIAPLFRACIYKLAPEEHVFFFMAHHIIWDGWSFDLLYDEMARLYALFDAGSTPLPEPLQVTYGDFAAWQRERMNSDDLEQQLGHWIRRLEPLPDPLELPADCPRPVVMSGAGSTEWIKVDKELTDALKDIAAHSGTTIFASLLSVYFVLLHRHSQQRDIIVGTPLRGRNSPDLEKIMGFFVNAVPLRMQLDPAMSFLQLLKEVRKGVVEAFAYPDVPFEHLVHSLRVPRDESRPPIFQALFSYQDVRDRPISWGNLKHSRVPPPQGGAAEDVALWFVENAKGIVGGLKFNTDILTQESAGALCERFLSLVRAIVASPDLPIGKLAVIGDKEAALLARFNPSASTYDHTAVTHELIEAHGESSRCAVRFGDESWSYGQLESYANRMAHCLRARGIRRGSRVGICLDRSIEMVGSLLAVLKAGGAYVPLDPVYPVERLRFMVEDADLAVLVSEGELATALEFPADRTLRIDADAAEIEAVAATRLPRDTEAADADSIAYVIYTSGSTGKPKGVQVQHQAVVNLLCSLQREPGLSSRDRLLAVTTISFDIHVLELWLPLMSGAEVVLAGRDTLLDTAALRALLESSGATCMQATPTLWRPLIEAGWKGTDTFKVLSGGESLPADLAEQLLERCGELWNLYGPTETTVWSTCCRVSNPRAAISIGRPIANTCVYVLDEQQQLCPIGVPGEMYIGGDGVTAGYLNRADLTAERFPPDPYSNQAGARLYRTGDRGRWLANGTLEHLGRLDLQVKLRGFRIELEEVEAAIRDHEVVNQAVVVVRGDNSIEPRLVAYVAFRPGESATSTELRRFLRARLPDYMLPNQFVELDTLPLTDNGKLNRLALPALTDHERVTDVQVIEPRTEIERDIAAVWQEMLGIKSISIRDNFFELGGHSLLAAQMVARLAQSVGYKLKLRSVIFETLEQIAAGVETAESVAH